MEQLQPGGEQSWGALGEEGAERGSRPAFPQDRAWAVPSLLLFIIFLQGRPIPLEEANLGVHRARARARL